jgi:hypothetical protein
MKDCNHTIGFIFGEEYDSSGGEILSLSSLSLSYFDKLNSDEINSCKFCPECGIELKDIILHEVERIKLNIKLKLEEDTERKAVLSEKFKLSKLKIINSTRLKNLSLTDSYYVSYYSPKKDIDAVVTGDVDFISGVICRELDSYKGDRDFNIYSIIKCPSKEDFFKACVKEGWILDGEVVHKSNMETKTVLDYSESGIVYVTFIGEDDDEKDYSRGSFVYILSKFNIPFECKEA